MASSSSTLKKRSRVNKSLDLTKEVLGGDTLHIDRLGHENCTLTKDDRKLIQTVSEYLDAWKGGEITVWTFATHAKLTWVRNKLIRRISIVRASEGRTQKNRTPFTVLALYAEHMRDELMAEAVAAALLIKNGYKLLATPSVSDRGNVASTVLLHLLQTGAVGRFCAALHRALRGVTVPHAELRSIIGSTRSGAGLPREPVVSGFDDVDQLRDDEDTITMLDARMLVPTLNTKPRLRPRRLTLLVSCPEAVDLSEARDIIAGLDALRVLFQHPPAEDQVQTLLELAARVPHVWIGPAAGVDPNIVPPVDAAALRDGVFVGSGSVDGNMGVRLYLENLSSFKASARVEAESKKFQKALHRRGGELTSLHVDSDSTEFASKVLKEAQAAGPETVTLRGRCAAVAVEGKPGMPVPKQVVLLPGSPGWLSGPSEHMPLLAACNTLVLPRDCLPFVAHAVRNGVGHLRTVVLTELRPGADPPDVVAEEVRQLFSQVGKSSNTIIVLLEYTTPVQYSPAMPAVRALRDYVVCLHVVYSPVTHTPPATHAAAPHWAATARRRGGGTSSVRNDPQATDMRSEKRLADEDGDGDDPPLKKPIPSEWYTDLGTSSTATQKEGSSLPVDAVPDSEEESNEPLHDKVVSDSKYESDGPSSSGPSGTARVGGQEPPQESYLADSLGERDLMYGDPKEVTFVRDPGYIFALRLNSSDEPQDAYEKPTFPGERSAIVNIPKNADEGGANANGVNVALKTLVACAPPRTSTIYIRVFNGEDVPGSIVKEIANGAASTYNPGFEPEDPDTCTRVLIDGAVFESKDFVWAGDGLYKSTIDFVNCTFMNEEAEFDRMFEEMESQHKSEGQYVRAMTWRPADGHEWPYGEYTLAF